MKDAPLESQKMKIIMSLWLYFLVQVCLSVEYNC